MISIRLPRFKRAPGVATIHITERDRLIIHLIHQHRFLRSSQIVALLGSSHQPVIRRLQLLYHHGYVERPRAQLDYYHQGGSRKIVYGLGNKSEGVLRKEGLPVHYGRLGEKNRAVGRLYLEHALLVSEIMVSIELACRKHGIQLLTGDQLLSLGRQSSFRWQVETGGGLKLGVIPDRVFALEQNGKRTFFFLEADRGTMPVVRKNLSQTSLYCKLLAYAATREQSLHKTQFGFHRFRVVIVTKSPERVDSLLQACSQLKRGHGMFLFADRAILQSPDILSALWQTGRSGITDSLLDQPLAENGKNAPLV